MTARAKRLIRWCRSETADGTKGLDAARTFGPSSRRILVSGSGKIGDRESLEQEIYKTTQLPIEVLRGKPL